MSAKVPCGPACWTDVDCTVCGRRKYPRGRSMPMESGGYCTSGDCDGYHCDPRPPHLYGPHDSDRAYTDPDGWAAHVAECDGCRGEESP